MKIKLIVLIILISVLLCGCNGSRELENRDFVLASGTERTKNGYKASVGIAVLSQDSSEVGSELSVKTAEGRTVDEAFKNLDKVTSGKLYYGQCVAVLTDEKSKDAVVDFCTDNREISGSVIMLNCIDAENVLSQKSGNNTSASFIEKYYGVNDGVRKITLNDVYISKLKGRTVDLTEIAVNDGELVFVG